MRCYFSPISVAKNKSLFYNIQYERGHKNRIVTDFWWRNKMVQVSLKDKWHDQSKI